jgi:hypothetical protein
MILDYLIQSLLENAMAFFGVVELQLNLRMLGGGGLFLPFFYTILFDCNLIINRIS